MTAVFGTDTPVQRCRQHKIENVIGYVPSELKDEMNWVINAAYRLSAREGIARLETQADWLDTQYPWRLLTCARG